MIRKKLFNFFLAKRKLFRSLNFKTIDFSLWLLIFLLMVGLALRLYGLNENVSFWSDENVVAIFTRAIIERGKPILMSGYSTGTYQWLQYFLSAFFAKVFGLSEFSIILPSVFFGVLTIWAIYLLGKELFGDKVGILSAFLVTFLNIEILWSRQARPYQSLQFFYLLSSLFVYKITKKENPVKNSLGFLFSSLLASLMHGLGLIAFTNGLLYLFLVNIRYLKSKIFSVGILIFGLIVYFFKTSILMTFSKIGSVNNLFYFRVFLTHNYLPLVIFAGLGGFLLLINKKYQLLLLLSIFLGIQLMIVSFVLGKPFVRYLYPVIPFIILLSSYGIFEISKIIVNQLAVPESKVQNSNFKIRPKRVGARFFVPFALILLTFFILYKSGKVSLFPQKVYSLNSDMQEVPEVDWKRTYGYVEENFKKYPDLILVTNWNDFPIWYLGEEASSRFIIVRKSGQNNSEKDFAFGERMIYSLFDFESLTKTYKKGIAVFDSWDDQIADGVREYCRENLKKEMEVDRLYPVQPRYWPVEVYSWGMD